MRNVSSDEPTPAWLTEGMWHAAANEAPAATRWSDTLGHSTTYEATGARSHHLRCHTSDWPAPAWVACLWSNSAREAALVMFARAFVIGHYFP